MTPLRRWMGALALAALLSSAAAANATTAPIGGRAPEPAHHRRAEICSQLADYSARLQTMPAGPLRDALLRLVTSLQNRYCG